MTTAKSELFFIEISDFAGEKDAAIVVGFEFQIEHNLLLAL
jgi:hypothetical protein